MKKKHFIYYDFSRLYTRLTNTTPTGIDRVEIRYLKGRFDKPDDFEVIGLMEGMKDGECYFIYLSTNHAKLLCEYMYGKWISGKYTDIEFLQAMQKLSMEIQKSLHQVSFASGTRLDRRIHQFLASNKRRSAYFNPSFTAIRDGFAHARTVKSMGVTPYYIIHDLIPIEFPEYFWDGWAKSHIERLVGAAQIGGQLIAISDHVKNKITEILEALNIGHEPIHVLRNGTEDLFIQNRFRSPHEYKFENQFTIVSTIEPRKNHLMLLNIWRSLIDTGISKAPKLVIIGARGWSNENVFKILDHSLALKAHVVERIGISDAEMIAEIKRSRATLFPSFDEGWGLPIVESLALGVPVICSDIPVHRECSQGYASYIDPIDAKAWRDTIISFCGQSQEEARQQHLHACKFAPIQWKDSVGKLIDIFKNIHPMEQAA